MKKEEPRQKTPPQQKTNEKQTSPPPQEKNVEKQPSPPPPREKSAEKLSSPPPPPPRRKSSEKQPSPPPRQRSIVEQPPSPRPRRSKTNSSPLLEKDKNHEQTQPKSAPSKPSTPVIENIVPISSVISNPQIFQRNAQPVSIYKYLNTINTYYQPGP